MPYYCHNKGADPLSGMPRATAADAARDLKSFGESHKITFQPTAEESYQWKSRERDRFDNGTYVRTPWDDADEYPDHFAHLSLTDPGMIAYTKSVEHGIQDRQTRVRPGKYLQEFYSHCPRETIARYVAQCSADAYALNITRDPDEIERVYIGGPSSCMAHKAHTYTGHCHPTRVYGGEHSDLALAWYGPDMDHVSARAIVWPDKHIYSRIYGGAGVLERLLESAGYESGSLNGARITAIEDRNGNGFIMPYVDGLSQADVRGKSIVLGSRGEIDAQRTDGVSSDSDSCYCESCENNVSEGDYHGDGMCRDCFYQDNFSCGRCGSDESNDNAYSTPDGDTYCESCFDRRYARCAGRNCDEVIRNYDENRHSDGEYYCVDCMPAEMAECYICDDAFDASDFTADEDTDRESRHMDDCCRACSDEFSYCRACSQYVTRSATPETDDDVRYDGIREIPPPPETRYDTFCPVCESATRPPVEDMFMTYAYRCQETA